MELVFDCEEERLAEKLKSMDLEPSEDGTVILSRKLSSGKSICRINGETVTAKQVKELSELLIDIHGQHEHQSLLNKKKHMEILDAYAGAEFAECAGRVAALYHECTALEKKITEETLDDTSRSREQSLAEFEQKESGRCPACARRSFRRHRTGWPGPSPGWAESGAWRSGSWPQRKSAG